MASLALLPLQHGTNSEEDVLRLAALAEMHSNHPIALSIKRAYTKPLEAVVSSYEELAGYGIKANIDDQTVLAGNDKLLVEQNIAHEKLSTPDTVVYVVVEGVLAGYLTIADEPKEDSERAILALKALGIKEIVMLTGDNKETRIKGY